MGDPIRWTAASDCAARHLARQSRVRGPENAIRRIEPTEGSRFDRLHVFYECCTSLSIRPIVLKHIKQHRATLLESPTPPTPPMRVWGFTGRRMHTRGAGAARERQAATSRPGQQWDKQQSSGTARAAVAVDRSCAGIASPAECSVTFNNISSQRLRYFNHSHDTSLFTSDIIKSCPCCCGGGQPAPASCSTFATAASRAWRRCAAAARSW
jgi:hypothetical protein